MGLLNYLFGSKKDIAKELVMDDNRRMALWNEHLSNYLLRERLSKHFSFGNVDKALSDFEATEKVLKNIECLISPELVNIVNEEKTDAEILADIKQLKSNPEIEKLSAAVLIMQTESELIRLFQEIFTVLKAELYLIRLIRKKPLNVRELLLRLFGLIFHQEAMLYKVFMEKYFSKENEHIHKDIIRIARAIIIEEEIKAEIETDEEKFAREIAMCMAEPEPKQRYRKLGEDIFDALAQMAGAPLSHREDITKGIRRMEGFMQDDKIMCQIVRKLRPKYDSIKIKAVVLAFRKAYNLGHFIELEPGFAT